MKREHFDIIELKISVKYTKLNQTKNYKKQNKELIIPNHNVQEQINQH